MKKALREIAYRIKRNPVLIGAAVLWAFETLGTGDPITWRSAVAVAVGVLVRSKVVPLNEAKIVTSFIEDLTAEMSRAADEAEEPQVKRLGGTWS